MFWRLEETCYHSNSSRRPSVDAYVKNSQGVVVIIKIIIMIIIIIIIYIYIYIYIIQNPSRTTRHVNFSGILRFKQIT